MDYEDHSVLYRDDGGYLSDEQLDHNDGTMNDEDMLKEALRSANKMLAAEGIGTMVGINFRELQDT
ncbi:hypothetical protein GGI21_004987, partial [Coemansia aciculifera]